MEATRCGACGLRFAWINLIANITMAVIKATIGVLAGSTALLVSSLYSINDVLSAAAVLTSLKIADRPPDENHPFGYGKVEYLAVGIVSLVLAASVCFFVYALFGIVHGSGGPPSAIVILVALLSLCVSEFLARRGFCVAKHLDSPALHTSAHHNREDAIGSGAVLIGTIGALLGFHVLDMVVAAFEALDIMRLGGSLLGQSVKGLMDSALPPDKVESLRRVAEDVPGVVDVHTIRSRRSGSQAWVDMVITVAEGESVAKAHQVSEDVHRAVEDALGPRARVQVAFRSRKRPVLDQGVEAHA